MEHADIPADTVKAKTVPPYKKPAPPYRWLDVRSGDLMEIEPDHSDKMPLSLKQTLAIEKYAAPLRLCALYWHAYSSTRKYTVVQAAIAKHAFFGCFAMVLPS